jgi:hypothetical protein
LFAVFRDPLRRYSGLRTVLQCGCGYEFCFLCQQQGHQPAACWEWEQWSKYCAENIDVER